MTDKTIATEIDAALDFVNSIDGGNRYFEIRSGVRKEVTSDLRADKCNIADLLSDHILNWKE